MSANSGLNFPGIYTITCVNTEKVYVGQAINIRRRWHSHKWHLRKNDHRNAHLQRAWNKYGESAFVFAVAESMQGVPDEGISTALNSAEIAVLSSIESPFNLMEAAVSGTRPSAETRAKLSEIRKAMWKDPEFIARRKAGHMSAINTPEWKERHAELARERSLDKNFREKMKAVNKKNWEGADERRKSRGALGKKLWKDPAYREKQRSALSASWAALSAEDRQKRVDAAQDAKARNRAARLAKDQNAT